MIMTRRSCGHLGSIAPAAIVTVTSTATPPPTGQPPSRQWRVTRR